MKWREGLGKCGRERELEREGEKARERKREREIDVGWCWLRMMKAVSESAGPTTL